MLQRKKLFELSLEHGASDFEVAEEFYVIITPPDELYKVKDGLDTLNLPTMEVDLEIVPKTLVKMFR